jgi:hypothetical protein
VISLLLTLFWLSCSSCRPRVIISPIFIGEARIVGKVEAGRLAWAEKEKTDQNAYVVTPAFVKLCLSLAIQNRELKAEIQKLLAKEK